MPPVRPIAEAAALAVDAAESVAEHGILPARLAGIFDWLAGRTKAKVPGRLAQESELSSPGQTLTDSAATALLFSTDNSGSFAGGLLPRRRFLSPDSTDSVTFEKLPYEQDWRLRKEALSRAVAEKINEQQLEETDFWKPIQAFSSEEQPIVKRLLELSAGNSTDRGIMQSLKLVTDQLGEDFPGRLNLMRFFVATPTSSGNMLAYLMRKSVGAGAMVFHLGDEPAVLKNLNPYYPVVVVDDVSKMPEAGRQALLQAQKTHNVVLVDVNSFDRLPNVLDFALGQPAVESKLRNLLADIKQHRAGNPLLSEEESIQQILRQPFEDAKAQLSAQAPEGSLPIRILRSVPVAPESAFRQSVQPHDVQNFLEREFGNQEIDQRIAAAEMLAQDVQFYSLKTLVPALQDLHGLIKESARQQHLKADDDIFVVATDGHGLSYQAASETFITHMYLRANGLSPDKVLTFNQLQALARSGNLGSERVVALDDAIYSGNQASSLLRELSELPSLPHAALANLSTSAKFSRSGALEPQRLISLQTDFSLNTNYRPPHLQYDALDTQVLDQLLHGGEMSRLSSLIVFPHMASDTSPGWLRDFAINLNLISGGRW